MNGPVIQGAKFNGFRFNNTGINVGGHNGVSLNGQCHRDRILN